MECNLHQPHLWDVRNLYLPSFSMISPVIHYCPGLYRFTNTGVREIQISLGRVGWLGGWGRTSRLPPISHEVPDRTTECGH